GGSWNFYATGSNITNIGDHLGVATSGSRAWVLWTDDRGPAGLYVRIYGVRIDQDIATPVAVSGFRGDAGSRGVSLRWTVSDASGLAGFRVGRSEGEEAYQLLETNLISARGAGEYREDDSTATPGKRYHY